LVLYSSRTGNTKIVAEAIAGALRDSELRPVRELPADLTPYDLLFLGFWAFRRGADMETRAVVEKLSGKRIALFATAGAYSDSPSAKSYLENTAALLEGNNTYLGGFICQGRVHSYHVSRRGPHTEEVHPLTPERRDRLEEAEKHPDAEDLARAAAFAREMEKEASIE